MNYASGGSRFLSGLVDTLIFIAISIFLPNGGFSSSISLILVIAYSTWMIGMYGATIGMMIVKIRVIKEDGSKVIYADALLREIASFLSFIVFLIGYLGIWT